MNPASTGLLFGFGLLTLACDARSRSESGSSSASAPSPVAATPQALCQRAARALSSGDAQELAGLSPATGVDVRVEIKQSLVETDERTAETLHSRAELEAWLGRTRPKWTCSGDDCTWPQGFLVGALARCLGDCCFSDWPDGIEKKALYLSRICVAGREGNQPRLSYIGFVEAK
ncbi:MAG: hypothetical protein IPI67_09810 [Myxococcales bacterium]|nr:hypothetical protein [Myxococcales bacterium]